MDGSMMVHSTVGESQDDGDELYHQHAASLRVRLRDWSGLSWLKDVRDQNYALIRGSFDRPDQIMEFGFHFTNLLHPPIMSIICIHGARAGEHK